MLPSGDHQSIAQMLHTGQSLQSGLHCNQLSLDRSTATRKVLGQRDQSPLTADSKIPWKNCPSWVHLLGRKAGRSAWKSRSIKRSGFLHSWYKTRPSNAKANHHWPLPIGHCNTQVSHHGAWCGRKPYHWKTGRHRGTATNQMDQSGSLDQEDPRYIWIGMQGPTNSATHGIGRFPGHINNRLTRCPSGYQNVVNQRLKDTKDSIYYRGGLLIYTMSQKRQHDFHPHYLKCVTPFINSAVHIA